MNTGQENTCGLRQVMNSRIRTCISYFGWQHTINLIKKSGVPFDKLRIAEVGCGTGTFSLTFCLLGASVTLIDYNKEALQKAKEIYELYGCDARYIENDCLDGPPQELIGKFDFVISGGLAEHFRGEDRKRVIGYHKLLLKEGGFTYIGVPNRLSPFYQCIRGFRILTGSWDMEVEIPYSNRELKRLAGKLGFKRFYCLGTAPVIKDMYIHLRGFISALIDILPANVQDKIRRIGAVEASGTAMDNEALKEMLVRRAFEVESNIGKKGSLADSINERFGSGIGLFAFT